MAVTWRSVAIAGAEATAGDRRSAGQPADLAACCADICEASCRTHEGEGVAWHGEFEASHGGKSTDERLA